MFLNLITIRCGMSDSINPPGGNCLRGKTAPSLRRQNSSPLSRQGSTNESIHMIAKKGRQNLSGSEFGTDSGSDAYMKSPSTGKNVRNNQSI